MEYLAIADPATTSVFGVLFVGWSELKQRLFIFDEIYERDTENTRLSILGPKMDEKAFSVADKWEGIYDPAERWFGENIIEHSKIPWAPCKKLPNHKNDGLSQIKDLYFSGRLYVHKRISWLHWEVQNYKKRKTRMGSYVIPNENDHLIDCLRYAVEYFNIDVRPDKPFFPVRRKTREEIDCERYGLSEVTDFKVTEVISEFDPLLEFPDW